MKDDRIPKQILFSQLEQGSRTAGGQRKRYKDLLKANFKACNINHHTWQASAENRMEWRSMCHLGIQSFERRRAQKIAPRLGSEDTPRAFQFHLLKVRRGSVSTATGHVAQGLDSSAMCALTNNLLLSESPTPHPLSSIYFFIFLF